MNNSSNSDSINSQKTSEKETDTEHQKYKGAEIAFVKDGKLYFYYPQNNETKQLEEEKETVFNCVFDNTTDLIYYTVERDSLLWLKKANYSSEKPLEITEICNLKVKKEECITSTYSEKTLLIFSRAEEIILPYNFVWDFFNFTKMAVYSTLKGDNTVEHKELNYDYINEFWNYEDNLQHQVKNNNLIYKGQNLSENLNLKVDEGMDIEFTEFKFSIDRSKLLFGAFLAMGDLAHGPYCISNINGTHQQILVEDGLSSPFKPFYLGNKVVFWQQKEGKSEYEYYKQLCITNEKDNSISVIEKELDYYTVREKIE